MNDGHAVKYLFKIAGKKDNKHDTMEIFAFSKNDAIYRAKEFHDFTRADAFMMQQKV